MSFKRSYVSASPATGERRSGLNRRWIKGPYNGVDRRSGKDRRSEPPLRPPLEAGGGTEEPGREVESYLLATAVRLEALVRVLQRRDLLSVEELETEVAAIQEEIAGRRHERLG